MLHAAALRGSRSVEHQLSVFISSRRELRVDMMVALTSQSTHRQADQLHDVKSSTQSLFSSSVNFLSVAPSVSFHWSVSGLLMWTFSCIWSRTGPEILREKSRRCSWGLAKICVHSESRKALERAAWGYQGSRDDLRSPPPRTFKWVYLLFVLFSIYYCWIIWTCLISCLIRFHLIYFAGSNTPSCFPLIVIKDLFSFILF